MVSRSNPFTTPRRCAKKTVLFYCEGYGDVVWVLYLKSLYNRNSGVGVTIKNNHGGGPAEVVSGACRHRCYYDRVIVVVDNDRSEDEIAQARQLADSQGFELVEHFPCLEAVLLKVLEGKKRRNDLDSIGYKKWFESNYIDGKKRQEREKYERVFPRLLIEARRRDVGELDGVVRVLMGEE